MKGLEKSEKSRELIKGIAKGVLVWYPFESGTKVLCVDSNDFYMEELLREKELEVTVITTEEILEEGFWRKAQGPMIMWQGLGLLSAVLSPQNCFVIFRLC